MKSPLSEAEFVKQESIYGRLPLLPDEREYDTRGARRSSGPASGSPFQREARG